MKTISLAELARRLGVSQPTISKISDSIPGQVRIGLRLRFREDIAMDFFANGGMPNVQKYGSAARPESHA